MRELEHQGHTLAVLHRGNAQITFGAGVDRILGDRNLIAANHEQIRRFAADVVIDFLLSSSRQAQELMGAMHGIAQRVIAISSMDVYRAFGVIKGTEPGPPDPLPLTEDLPLRSRPLYSSKDIERFKSIFAWATEDYEKIAVEREVLRDPALPGTVLRLPMVYGPGDPLHRFYPTVKRIVDGRRQILLADDFAAWQTPRGYVENVAAAIALAAIGQPAPGRIYNVNEEPSFSELDWAQKIAKEMDWNGEFILLARERTPPHLVASGRLMQDANASSARIRRELGYREPVSIEEGIRRTVMWQKAHSPSNLSLYPFDYAAEDAALRRSGANTGCSTDLRS